MIDRGKRIKTLSEVKPVDNISKNLQSFLEIRSVKRWGAELVDVKHLPQKVFLS